MFWIVVCNAVPDMNEADESNDPAASGEDSVFAVVWIAGVEVGAGEDTGTDAASAGAIGVGAGVEDEGSDGAAAGVAGATAAEGAVGGAFGCRTK